MATLLRTEFNATLSRKRRVELMLGFVNQCCHGIVLPKEENVRGGKLEQIGVPKIRTRRILLPLYREKDGVKKTDAVYTHDSAVKDFDGVLFEQVKMLRLGVVRDAEKERNHCSFVLNYYECDVHDSWSYNLPQSYISLCTSTQPTIWIT
jgi:hypothetical protein